MDKKWWKEGIVYQIYPKSFYDTNGDGIGDLNGIIDKLDYLKELGIDVLWLSPIYQSPMDDNGYDISDYYKIDPIFGSNKDMDELIKQSDKRGIKIIMDLVINHCSDEHRWFKKALEDPNSEEAEYFYFKRTEDEKIPNNWRSNFGGSAWEKTEDGRFYLHTFSKKQPDLNWENPVLREKLYSIINWWLDRGIAGFRVDAITFIKKDTTFASQDTEDGSLYPIEKFENYPGICEFLTELKERTFDKYNCMTVGEAPGVYYDQLKDYAGQNGYFSMIFDFTYDHLSKDYSSDKDEKSINIINQWRNVVFKSQLTTQKIGWSPVFLENHDQPRCPNKFLKEDDIRYHSITMLATLYFLLRGTPFIYQGQELGMTNCHMNSIEEFQDTMAHTKYLEAISLGKIKEEILEDLNQNGRDNARTPFQWNDGENAGFTTGVPWIKINENYKQINVKLQEKNNDSVLNYYKKLIALRKNSKYKEVLVYGTFEPYYEEYDNIVAYTRTIDDMKVMIINNFSNQINKIELTIATKIKNVILNNYKEIDFRKNHLLLKPYQSVSFEI
jgi:glycosidase